MLSCWFCLYGFDTVPFLCFCCDMIKLWTLFIRPISTNYLSLKLLSLFTLLCCIWYTFRIYSCALCPASHEDLTEVQIDSLLHHRWGVRKPPTIDHLGLPHPHSLKSKGQLSTGSLLDDSVNRRGSKPLLGWLFPPRELSPRERLLNHCIYLQV